MRIEGQEPEICQCCKRLLPLHGNGACDGCVDRWEEAAVEAAQIRKDYDIAKGRRDPEE